MAAKKIKLSLDVKEINALVNMLADREKKINMSFLAVDFEIPMKAKLLKTLTKDQKKEFIDLEVKKVLSIMTGIPTGKIKNSHDLSANLHMNSIQIRALAVPFTNIARHFNPSAVITPGECEDCSTVDDCVELVFSKS